MGQNPAEFQNGTLFARDYFPRLPRGVDLREHLKLLANLDQLAAPNRTGLPREADIFDAMLEESTLPQAHRNLSLGGVDLSLHLADPDEAIRFDDGHFRLPVTALAGRRYRIDFAETAPRALLLIEKEAVARQLQIHPVLRRAGWLVLGTCGLPEIYTLRFIQHLHQKYRLPLYVLADNDTWGYFYFSILKRGALLPHLGDTELAMPRARFLGLRAEALQPFGAEAVTQAQVAWKSQWDLRLNAMAQYRCFRSEPWQEEFATFRRQAGKVELEPGWVMAGTDWLVDECILNRVAREEWLA